MNKPKRPVGRPKKEPTTTMRVPVKLVPIVQELIKQHNVKG